MAWCPLMFVLNFHGLGKPARKLESGEQDVWLELSQFEEIIDSVSDLDDVHLTFDDGNASDVAEALPVLLHYGRQAQFFLCAGRFGAAEFLDETRARVLHAAGMPIGSHGMNHIAWRKLPISELNREIAQAKQLLEDVISASVDAAACPFGAYDRLSLNALRLAEFNRVYTSDGGSASSTDWLVARNTIHRWDSPELVQRLLNHESRPARMAREAKRWIKQWR